jgi:glycyl-tRNA synthetase alpha subunit
MSGMKKLYFFIILFSACTLTSCVDIVERYNFKANGTCDVIYDFDMSRAVSVLHNLLSDSVAATPQFAMVKDTVMNLYSALPDSTQNKMSKDEMKLAQSSDLAINMNLKQSRMKVSIRHQSESPAEMEYYLQQMSKLVNYDQLGKKNKNLNMFNAQQLIAGQECYAYQVTSSKFIRIIDKAKFNAFLKKTGSTFAMAKAMLIETPYKVVLNFAKPVKKIDNKNAVLSADRKQVILQTNMDELIKNPNLMNLRIDF